MTVSKIRLPDNTEHDIRAKYLIQSSSADATSAEFSARTVTEDAIANIQKIYGNTVKFKQILSSFSASSGNNLTITSSQNNTAATVNGIANATNSKNFAPGLSWEIGHKYFISGISGGSSTTYWLSYTGGTSFLEERSVYDGAKVIDISSSQSGFYLVYKNGTNFNNVYIRPYIIDLTFIYGSGNEPTAAEFEAQYSTDYYPYDPGSLTSNSATAIQSKDANDNVIGNCDLNIPTLTGKLNGTGSSVVIFPDGMKKAGTVYDEIVGNKAIKRVGSVDLGGLTWYLDSTYGFYAAVSGKLERSNNGLCARYEAVSYNSSFTSKDDVICVNMRSLGAVWGDRVVVRDSSYSDATTFKTAMSGVTLYYELATPEEYILDNALQFQYPVVAGGTEMVLPTIGTAPMKMDVIYGNAADAAATMSQNYISVDSMKEFLAALGTQMGGTWSMGYENGKHTFTFASN